MHTGTLKVGPPGGRVGEMEVVRGTQRKPYVIGDGSALREVAGPVPGNACNQSLAEATVPPGGETIERYSQEDRVRCE